MINTLIILRMHTDSFKDLQELIRRLEEASDQPIVQLDTSKTSSYSKS